MRSSGVEHDDDETWAVFFKNLNNYKSLSLHYQHDLIRRGLKEICGSSMPMASEEVLEDIFPENLVFKSSSIIQSSMSSSTPSSAHSQSSSVPSSARSFASSIFYPAQCAATSSEASFSSSFGQVAPSIPFNIPLPKFVSFLSEYNDLITPGCCICQVQFKRSYRDFVISAQQLANHNFTLGDFLVVSSYVESNQIDLGILIRTYTIPEYNRIKESMGRSQVREENYIGVVLRLANRNERRVLPSKFAKEVEMIRFAQRWLQDNPNVPMTIQDIEFQFDGMLLFVYYHTKVDRVDYRRFVVDLMRETNNTRVKMKKITGSRTFIPNSFAQIALCTGSSIK